MKQFKIEPGVRPDAVDRSAFQGVEWDDGAVSVRQTDPGRGGVLVTSAYDSREDAYAALVKDRNREWWDLFDDTSAPQKWKPKKPWDDWPVGWGYVRYTGQPSSSLLFAHWNGDVVRVIGDRNSIRDLPHLFTEFIPVDIVPTEILNDVVECDTSRGSSFKLNSFRNDWESFKDRVGG